MFVRLAAASVIAVSLSGCLATAVVGGAVGATTAVAKTTGKVAVGTVKVTGKAAGAVLPGGKHDDDED